MKRTTAFLVVALAVVLGEWSPAAAQYAPPGGLYGPAYGRPRVSPYLNLLRSGTSAGVNYTTLVRPEFETRSALGQLRTQTLLTQQSLNNLQAAPAGGPVTTGHPVGFMTHTGYFQSYGGGGSPGFTIGGIGGGAAGGQGFQGPTSRGSGGGGGSGAQAPRGGRSGR